jgi:hypothetical protein
MNFKTFETYENTVLSERFLEKGLSDEIRQKWYDTILDNRDEFLSNFTYEDIRKKLYLLKINEIDDDIVNLSADVIAFENNIDESSDGISVCMMLYSTHK